MVLNIAPKAIRSLKIHNAKQMAQVKSTTSQLTSHPNQLFNDIHAGDRSNTDNQDGLSFHVLSRQEKKELPLSNSSSSEILTIPRLLQHPYASRSVDRSSEDAPQMDGPEQGVIQLPLRQVRAKDIPHGQDIV